MNDNPLSFPHGLQVAQVRIARPTDRLRDVVRFYHEGLGLPIVGAFADHEGYDGYMLGLPGRAYHLEFTQREGDGPCPAPSEDNLLVFYVPDAGQRECLHARLEAIGARAVPPENPYWRDKSRTYADPDGWRVVICSVTGV